MSTEVLAEAGPAREAGFVGYPNEGLDAIVPAEELAESRRSRGKSLALLRRVRIGFAVVDATCLLLALALVAPRWGALSGSGGRLVPAVLVDALAWVIVFRAFGLYRLHRPSAWEEFRRLVGATGLGSLLAFLLAPAWGGSFSRAGLAAVWLVSLFLVVALRTPLRSWIGRLTERGTLAMRVALVGPSAEAKDIAAFLSATRRGYMPVGRVVGRKEGPVQDDLPVLGSIDELGSIIDRHDIECVFLPPGVRPEDEILRIARACREANVELRFWANVPGILAGRLRFQPIEDVSALVLAPVQLSGVRALLKRALDLAIASVALLLSLPFIVLAAFAIRTTSRGPVFFRQSRVTKDGRVFTMYKLRTMVSEPKQALDGKLVDLTKPFFKLKHDPRLTPVGRLLRRWSLDEVAQLFNVLRGDMSMVGPRPLPLEQVAANLDFLRPRHEVRCGITGWWQISGRSDVDSDEALRLDQFYIENWSMGLDFYILLRTFGAVLTRRGAF
jgi:exopolysaccharide biosynthesis polyprenyl glycosylphosphotransferase